MLTASPTGSGDGANNDITLVTKFSLTGATVVLKSKYLKWDPDDPDSFF